MDEKISIRLIAEQLPDDCQPIRPGKAGILYAVSELARKRDDAKAGEDLLNQSVKELEERYRLAEQVIAELSEGGS